MLFVPTDNVAAILLAGGRSRRMGRDKAGLPYGSSSFLEHMYLQLVKVLSPEQVWVSGSRSEYLHSVPDLEPHLGPLGGVWSVFTHWKKERIYPNRCLIVPLDMPLLGVGTLKKLLQEPSIADVTYFSGYELPMLLKVHSEVEAVLKHVLFEKKDSFRSFRELKKRLSKQELSVSGMLEDEFQNVNTPRQFLEVAG